jgi:hypothetical protein
VAENTDIPEDDLHLFATTKKSKPVIIEGLVVSFEAGTLRYRHDDEAGDNFLQMHRELGEYQLEDEGLVQDTVMSLAIAEHHSGLAWAKAKKRGKGRRIIRVA